MPVSLVAVVIFVWFSCAKDELTISPVEAKKDSTINPNLKS
jgi:hypothetical protein